MEIFKYTSESSKILMSKKYDEYRIEQLNLKTNKWELDNKFKEREMAIELYKFLVEFDIMKNKHLGRV